MPDNEQNYSRATTEYSRVIPVWKFALFSIASLGLYQLYWNYKSWEFLKEKDNLEVSPFWRTFFMPIFLSSLFDRFSDMLKADGHQTSYPTPLLIIIWVILNTYCPYAEGPIWLAYYLSFLALTPILSDLNVYWKDVSPELPEKLLTAWQIVLLMAGIFFFFIILLGTLILE
ncbi:hypothetical protein ACSAZL_07890 [Methanosarcina sp. T3]|uniref:hypothetical protein n=1 Tax=Methanosarcina sp. T3 TaxID=3439062 RepID=UPI003F85C4A1